jgi:hypothetical protein
MGITSKVIADIIAATDWFNMCQIVLHLGLYIYYAGRCPLFEVYTIQSLVKWNHVPRKLAQVAKLLTCIRGVLCSNLGWNTTILRFLLVCLGPARQMPGYWPRLSSFASFPFHSSHIFLQF